LCATLTGVVAAVDIAALPLLERDEELARLDEMIAGALAGTGRLVVIEGEAGVGKSSLVAAAARWGSGAGRPCRLGPRLRA
jgi:MoxR-like ATPase